MSQLNVKAMLGSLSNDKTDFTIASAELANTLDATQLNARNANGVVAIGGKKIQFAMPQQRLGDREIRTIITPKGWGARGFGTATQCASGCSRSPRA